ncbi:hypothetical protein [Streptomyces sp. NPDC088762]|uniref:hypothetical protein n=1 Tax=Streptomyces sp. NPDC088762 TaxID=3365891 RepID=UPI0037F78DF9
MGAWLIRRLASPGYRGGRFRPTGCLLFYPGTPTTHRNPLLVGTSGWNTTITAIF